MGRFYQSGETLPLFGNPGGASAGKGSHRGSAWIMPLRTWIPLNLSKASQFGSALVGGRPTIVCVLGFQRARWVCLRCVVWNGGRRFVPIRPSGGRLTRACVPEILHEPGLDGAMALCGRPFFGSCGGMLSFFPPKCAKYSCSGCLGEHLRSR